MQLNSKSFPTDIIRINPSILVNLWFIKLSYLHRIYLSMFCLPTYVGRYLSANKSRQRIAFFSLKIKRLERNSDDLVHTNYRDCIFKKTLSFIIVDTSNELDCTAVFFLLDEDNALVLFNFDIFTVHIPHTHIATYIRPRKKQWKMNLSGSL